MAAYYVLMLFLFPPLIEFFYIASSNQSIYIHLDIVSSFITQRAENSFNTRFFVEVALLPRALATVSAHRSGRVTRECLSYFFNRFFVFVSYVRSARKRHFRDCALVARSATRETNGTHTCSRALEGTASRLLMCVWFQRPYCMTSATCSLK